MIIGKDRPKVLVIMASYNGELYIENQIESILNQEQVDVSIFIQDDNSCPRNVKYLEKITHLKKNISVKYNDKNFGSAGQNFFDIIRNIDLTGYEYIALSDQDDLWGKNKIIKGIKKINQLKLSGYSSAVEAFWPNGKIKKISQSSSINDTDFLFEGAGQGCTFVLTNKFFKKIQTFCNENIVLTKDFYYHDWFIYILCRSWEEKWFFDKKTYIKYRQHGNNDIGARSGFKAILLRIKLIKDGWYKKQVKLAIKIATKANANSSSLDKAIKFYNMPNIKFRKLRLIFFILKNGRRKLIDKLVQIFSVLFGFL